MKKTVTLTVAAVILSAMLYGQTIEMRVKMVKDALKEFSELQPIVFEKDDIEPETAVFVPLTEEVETNTYAPFLKDVSPMFSIDELNSSYTVINDEEYPVNSFKLICNYHNLPGFNILNAWFEVKKVEDLNGKNLLLSQEVVEKYRELGIINDDFGFVIPGEASEDIWLNRELEWHEKFNTEGTIHIEYPRNYSLAVFTPEESLKKKTINEVEFQLVQIKDNMVTYMVKGDRRKIDVIRVVLLNKDNKPFLSRSSMGIEGNNFDPETNAVKQLTDEEIYKMIENYNYSDYNVYQAKKVHVEGTIAKVVFLNVEETAPISHDFSITLEYYSEF